MKKLLLLTAWLTISFAAFADSVSRETAQRKAALALPSGGGIEMVAQAAGSHPAYYVFNARQTDGGFVVISGDDRTEEVLAYADNGSFDPQNIPTNMQYMLDCYEEQIEMIREGRTTPYKAPANHAAVLPLISTQWNQTEPYNDQCPTSGSQHCVTGCVATAMAQIIKYWSLPVQVKAIGSLPARTFKYDIMQDKYTSSSETGADEVAWLMRYCGQSVNMSYGTGTSSATASSAPFSTYFGFDTDVRMVTRASYTSTEWDNIIYGELSASMPRPVFYSGQSQSIGHAFVIDGYDGNGLYHINWGWGGQSDGFFKLALCNPSDLGTGGGTSKDGYSMQQSAIIGIQNEDGVAYTDYIKLTVEKLTASSTSYTRSSTTSNFSIGVQYAVFNKLSDTYTFEYAFGIYQDGNLIQTSTPGSNTLGANVGTSGTWTSTVYFGNGLTSGTYTLKAISRASGETDWKEDYNSNVYFLELEINGNTMTVTPKSYSYTVNSCDVEGKMVTGKPVVFKVNMTNTGTANTGTLAIIIGNSVYGAEGFGIDPGTTDDATVQYTPSSAGTYTAKIALVEKSSSGYSILEYLAEKTFTVTARPSTDLSGSTVSIENLDGQQITGNTFKVTVNVKNNSTAAFNDEITFSLWRVTKETAVSGGVSYSGTQEQSTTSEYTIASGETRQITLEFKDLAYGSKYWITGRTFDKKIYETDVFTITQPTAIELQTVVPTADGAWYNLQGIRIEKPTKAGIYIKNGRKVVVR